MGSVFVTRECCLCLRTEDVVYPDDWNGDPGRDPDLHPPVIPFAKGFCIFTAIPGRWDGSSAHEGKQFNIGEEKPITMVRPKSLPPKGSPIFKERKDWEPGAQKWAADNPDAVWAIVCDPCSTKNPAPWA